jgi:hypothetical protein
MRRRSPQESEDPETLRRAEEADRAGEQDRRAQKCRTALFSLIRTLIRTDTATTITHDSASRLQALLSNQVNYMPPPARDGALSAKDPHRSPAVRGLRHTVGVVENELAASTLMPQASPDAIRSLGDDILAQYPEAEEGLRELAEGSEEYVEDTLKIVRGTLDVVSMQPWVGNDTPLLLHMLPLMGERFKVVRDNHHVGWHYHYCKLNGERSDVVLTYQPRGAAPDPLYWEYHAKGKAKFKARVDRWGAERRASVYASCADDARTRQLTAYRPPSSDAEVLKRIP